MKLFSLESVSGADLPRIHISHQHRRGQFHVQHQVRTKIAFDRMIERVKPSERGQTAVEYAGIAFVVALVAGVLITKQGEIADEILKKIKEALTKIH